MDKIFESEQAHIINRPKNGSLTRFEFFNIISSPYVIGSILGDFAECSEDPVEAFNNIELLIHQSVHYCHPFQKWYWKSMLDGILDFTGDAISIKQMRSSLSKDDGIRFKNKEDAVQHYANIIVNATDNDQMLKSGFISSLKEYFESDPYKHESVICSDEELICKLLPGVESPIYPVIDNPPIHSIPTEVMETQTYTCTSIDQSNHDLIHEFAKWIYNDFVRMLFDIGISLKYKRVNIESCVMKPLFYGDEQLIKTCESNENVKKYMYDDMSTKLRRDILKVILSKEDKFEFIKRFDLWIDRKLKYLFGADKWKTLLE